LLELLVAHPILHVSRIRVNVFFLVQIMKAYGDVEVYLFSLISALHTGIQSASSLARFIPEDKCLSLFNLGSIYRYTVGFKPSSFYPRR
jgi:hypothetical protein